MKTRTQIIDEIFLAILRHLNGLDIKLFRRLTKTSLYACYDIGGTFLGTSQEPDGMINIKLFNIGKFKKGIEREVLLEKDYFLLDMERCLLKMNNLSF